MGEESEYKIEEVISLLFKRIQEFIIDDLKTKNKELFLAKEEIEYKYTIGIPSTFTSETIKVINNAAKISDWNNVNYLNEITAASIVYHVLHPLNDDITKRYLIIYMGYQYFNSSVIECTKDKVKVISSKYDSTIGSKVIDDIIINYAIEQFKNKNKVDIRSNSKSYARLMKASEKCKHVLSTINETDLTVESILNDIDLHIKINRSLIEEKSTNLTAKITDQIQETIKISNITINEIDVVEVFGGGIRVPFIQQLIKNIINNNNENTKELNFGLTNHSIAMGLSLYNKINTFGFQVEDPSTKQLEFEETTIENAVINNSKKQVNDLIEVSKLRSKISSIKNEIETYIYTRRNQIKENKYQHCFTIEIKSKLNELLSNTENWLNELDDSNLTLDILQNKYNEITKNVEEMAPLLQEQLNKEIEEKEKEQKEAEEYIKNYKGDGKERDIPRTKAQKIEAAKKKKNQGNICFKDNDYQNAITRYRQAVDLVNSAFDLSPEQTTEVNEIKVSCNLNLAATYLKVQSYNLAVDSSSEVSIFSTH